MMYIMHGQSIKTWSSVLRHDLHQSSMTYPCECLRPNVRHACSKYQDLDISETSSVSWDMHIRHAGSKQRLGALGIQVSAWQLGVQAETYFCCLTIPRFLVNCAREVEKRKKNHQYFLWPPWHKRSFLIFFGSLWIHFRWGREFSSPPL